MHSNLSVRLLIFRPCETPKEIFYLYCCYPNSKLEYSIWQLEGPHCCEHLIKSVLLWHKKQIKLNFTIQHESRKEFPEFQVVFISNL